MDELIRLSLDSGAPEEWQAHVRDCARCSQRSQTFVELLRQTADAHRVFEERTVDGRSRLMTALIAEDSPPKPLPKFWRIVMNRRNWLISASSAAMIAGVIVWNLISVPSVALADALKKMKESKSFSCVMSQWDGGKTDGPTNDLTIKLIWASPGYLRSDIVVKDSIQSSFIMPHDSAGLVIDHKDKKYQVIEKSQMGEQEKHAANIFQTLATYPAGDEKPSGIDEIDGVKSPRFDLLLNQRKSMEGEWDFRVWVHPETKRPLRVDFNIVPKEAKSDVRLIYRLEKFAWDIKTDDLFDTTPPKDYRNATLAKDEAIDMSTKQIVAFLGEYKVKFGTYPKAKRIDPVKIGAELDKLGKDKAKLTTVQGLVLMGVLQTLSKDAVYHGEKVGPDDKAKVLFRWKLEDGKYRVIFGDLQAETVTMEKLKTLEEK